MLTACNGMFTSAFYQFPINNAIMTITMLCTEGVSTSQIKKDLGKNA